MLSIRSNSSTDFSNLIVVNYIYFSFFESKLSVYHGYRTSVDIREIYDILQYIFSQPITQQQYRKFILKIVDYAVNTTEELNNMTGQRYSLQAINNALNKLDILIKRPNNDMKIILISEKVIEACVKIIANLESPSFQIKHTNRFSSIDMRYFTKEYQMLWNSVALYSTVDTTLNRQAIAPDTAFHEVHQGFTHLTRHVNLTLNDNKEILRFKSHIRRAALDFLKLSLESLTLHFVKKDDVANVAFLRVETAKIKNQEVCQVVSALLPDLKQKYTSLIKQGLARI